jgi:hypothetical protein
MDEIKKQEWTSYWLQHFRRNFLLWSFTTSSVANISPYHEDCEDLDLRASPRQSRKIDARAQNKSSGASKSEDHVFFAQIQDLVDEVAFFMRISKGRILDKDNQQVVETHDLQHFPLKCKLLI